MIEFVSKKRLNSILDGEEMLSYLRMIMDDDFEPLKYDAKVHEDEDY